MFSYVALEDRIPADHPLRGVRQLVDAVLAGMSKDFDGLYSQVGRPSIAPERLLRALLLQVPVGPNLKGFGNMSLYPPMCSKQPIPAR